MLKDFSKSNSLFLQVASQNLYLNAISHLRDDDFTVFRGIITAFMRLFSL